MNGANAESSANARSTKMLTTASRCAAKRSAASRHWLRGFAIGCARSAPAVRATVAISSVSRKRLETPLRIPDPRVEVAVEDVGEEVREDDERARDREDALQHRVVGPRRGIPEEAPHPRPAEDLLGDERADEELREVERDDRHERDRGVLEGVTHRQDALGQPLR